MQQLTPQQAYDFLQANPEAVFIDVRSEMEYMFVGHPANSILIPWVDGPDWEIDPNFVSHVKKAASLNPEAKKSLRRYGSSIAQK